MDLFNINQKIKHSQKASQDSELTEKQLKSDPFEQFIDWFNEILQTETCNPTAMVLATIDANNFPDTRVVLLKELELNRFIFYSSYDSKKAKQLVNNNLAAINFYWPNFSRQLRIRGHVEKIDYAKSQSYFETRPRNTQLGAHAWTQSSIINDRTELEKLFQKTSEKFSGKDIPCPNNWGGYALTPFEYEFFQGRNWRMHDRFLYTFQNEQWQIQRLAP